MRILFISRLYNSLEYKVMPFVYEQALALQQKGVFVYIYPLSVNNKFSYITEIINIKKIIQNFKPDIIHAHYGLCGMTANLQRKVPVVTTYHGSDIYLRTMLLFSRLVMRLSKWNIFVSQKCVDISKISCNYSIIPCGVNLNLFKDIDRDKAREILGLKKEIKYILFAGSFDDKVKNPELAQEIVSQFNNMKLIELKGYSREEVNILMHAVDACIMTSHSEGSPQFIKESLACNCKIVSVNVGDVQDIIGRIKGCHIVDTNIKDELCDALIDVINSEDIYNNGKEIIQNLGFDNESIADKLINVYNLVLKKSSSE